MTELQKPGFDEMKMECSEEFKILLNVLELGLLERNKEPGTMSQGN